MAKFKVARFQYNPQTHQVEETTPDAIVSSIKEEAEALKRDIEPFFEVTERVLTQDELVNFAKKFGSRICIEEPKHSEDPYAGFSTDGLQQASKDALKKKQEDCDHINVSQEAVQMRAADEAATIIFTCKDCGKVSRDEPLTKISDKVSLPRDIEAENVKNIFDLCGWFCDSTPAPKTEAELLGCFLDLVEDGLVIPDTRRW